MRRGLILWLAWLAPLSAAHAFSSGVSGMSGKPPAASCTGCHSANGTAAPSKLTLSGPMLIAAGAGATFTLAIEGLAAGAAFDIAVSDGTLAPADPVVKAQIRNGDLSHTSSWPHGKTVSFEFAFTAPAQPGKVTLYFTVMSANDDGGTGGDATASGTLDVTIGPPPDLAGADLAGIDFAVVDLATADSSAAKPKVYVDEPRWGLSCRVARPRTPGGPGRWMWLLLGAGSLLWRRWSPRACDRR